MQRFPPHSLGCACGHYVSWRSVVSAAVMRALRETPWARASKLVDDVHVAAQGAKAGLDAVATIEVFPTPPFAFTTAITRVRVVRSSSIPRLLPRLQDEGAATRLASACITASSKASM